MTDSLRVHDVTGLLLSWRQGDAAALDRLVPLVYDELRRVARRHLRREQPGHALQATALVHEVYLRLVDVDRLTLKNRTHFFAVAAKLMRQILVDHARRQHADKRGGGATMVSLDDVSPAAQPAERGRARPRSGARWRCPQSTPGNAASWNCDSSRGSTSTRRPKHWGYRPPRSSENGLWRRPGSFGGCRRNSDAGRRSRDLSGARTARDVRRGALASVALAAALLLHRRHVPESAHDRRLTQLGPRLDVVRRENLERIATRRLEVRKKALPQPSSRVTIIALSRGTLWLDSSGRA